MTRVPGRSCHFQSSFTKTSCQGRCQFPSCQVLFEQLIRSDQQVRYGAEGEALSVMTRQVCNVWAVTTSLDVSLPPMGRSSEKWLCSFAGIEQPRGVVRYVWLLMAVSKGRRWKNKCEMKMNLFGHLVASTILQCILSISTVNLTISIYSGLRRWLFYFMFIFHYYHRLTR